jgi:hypothetical protein
VDSLDATHDGCTLSGANTEALERGTAERTRPGADAAAGGSHQPA